MTSAVERVLSGDRPIDEPVVPAMPRPRPSPWIALAPLAWALAGWSLLAADGARVLPAIRCLLVVLWAIAGLGIGVQRPDERVVRIVLIGTVVGALGALGAADLSMTGAPVMRAAAIGLLPAFVLHLLVGLPSGHLGARRNLRGLVVTGYAVGVITGLYVWSERPDVPRTIVGAVAGVAIATGMLVSNWNYRHASATARQRMQWFGCAVAFVAEVGVIVLALHVLVDWPNRPDHTIAAATGLLAVALLASATRALEGRADRVLTQSVSAAGLTGVVLAVYIVVVLGLGRTPKGDERTLLVLSMLAAAVAAVVYLPARERLSRFSNRLVYGERQAPDEVLRTFGSRLSRSVPLDELLLQLVESLRKTLQLRAAEVWTGSEGILERAVSLPDRGEARITLTPSEAPVVAHAGVSGTAWARIWLPALVPADDAIMRVAPITSAGELLGLIVVERHPDDEQFDDEADLALTELARQVGLALRNVRLDSALQASLDEVRRQADQLRASRARIVASADAARRQIERNLHDGAQQHLVALAVNVRLARQLADSDLETAKAMLDELGTDLQAAVQELRDLAHGIYPPLLMDQGLVAALRAAATRSPLPAEVEAGDVGRHSPDIEAAVYFCCLEAMQNAGKHAGEGAVLTISLREDEGALLFDVADTGAGFDLESKGTGAGFVNMSDRVGAIGGSLRVDSALGEGTRISGMVPING